jgi:putative intracellular protease/amidase/ketosteroid isomerase-like protein
MTKILLLASSARTIELANGSHEEAGVFAAAALRPYDCFTAAGAYVAVATVDGMAPHIDRCSLEPVFHYPDEDQNFLASVTRTFMRNADDVRITFQHLGELDLIAARGIFEALKHAQVKPDQARVVIERTARKAWCETANFVAILSADAAVTAAVSVAQIRECADALRAEAKNSANKMRLRFSALPEFQKPIKLGELSIEEMLGYDAIFIPGGYGPMVDLADNPDVRRLLRVMHERSHVIAALAHGPAALLSAGYGSDGLWLFDGYRITAFTDEEEDQTRLGKLGLPWYLEAALKNCGAVFDDAPAAWTSHVVVDRNLITGQNPASTDAIADAVLKRVAAGRLNNGMNIGPQELPFVQDAASSGPSQKDARHCRLRDACSLSLELFKRLASRDADGVDALVRADAAVDFGPAETSGSFAQHGAKFLRDLIAAFPDLRVKVRSIMGNFETAVVEITVEGTQGADFLGIHNQKRRLDLDQAWVISASDGKIESIRAYWCQIQLYRRSAVKRLDQISITG